MPQEDARTGASNSDDNGSLELTRNSPPSASEDEEFSWRIPESPSAYPQASVAPASSVARGSLCTVCREPVRIKDMVRLQCGHVYDTSCMKAMYQRAIDDESAYPPKCCGNPIALSGVQAHLGLVLAGAFQRKEQEYRTANRVYCHNPRCSTFLRAATTFPVPSLCPTCKLRTCAQCKQRGHPGYGCSSHSKDESVLKMGRENGWKRCHFCQHLIELDIGCYHVRCRCGKEFCYKCGVAWKGCTCDLFYVPPEEDPAPSPPKLRWLSGLGLSANDSGSRR